MKKWIGNSGSSDSDKGQEKEGRVRSEYNKVKSKTKQYSSAISSKTKNLYNKSTSAVQKVIHGKDKRQKADLQGQNEIPEIKQMPTIDLNSTTLPDKIQQGRIAYYRYMFSKWMVSSKKAQTLSSSDPSTENSTLPVEKEANSLPSISLPAAVDNNNKSAVESGSPTSPILTDQEGRVNKIKSKMTSYYQRSKEAVTKLTSHKDNHPENEANSTTEILDDLPSPALDTHGKNDLQSPTKKQRFSKLKKQLIQKAKTITTPRTPAEDKDISSVVDTIVQIPEVENEINEIQLSSDSSQVHHPNVNVSLPLHYIQSTEDEYDHGYCILPPLLAQIYATTPFCYYERRERVKQTIQPLFLSKDTQQKAMNDSMIIQKSSLETQSNAQYVNIINPHFLVYRENTPVPNSSSYLSALISHPILPIQHILCMLKFCFSSEILSSSCPTTDIILKSHRIESELQRSASISEEMNDSSALTPSDYQCCTPALSTDTMTPPVNIQKTVEKYVSVMAGTQNRAVLRVFCWLLTIVFRWLFSGIYVDYNGAQVLYDELKVFMSQNIGIVFLPSHKSHFDYLLLSYISYAFNLPIPSIASGDNLNIPLVGSLFRNSGAFFMRRSFGDDKLYRAVFESYVEELLVGGSPLEFFIEGGRSRDGTILAPKLGLLKVIVDAFKNNKFDDILLVPISVDYEEIPEVKSYVNNLLGGKKTPESLTNLLKTAVHFLNKNFGNVFVTFGKPMSVKQLSKNLHRLQPEMSDKEELRFIGGNICHAMRENIIATSSTILSAILLWEPTISSLSFDTLCSRATKLHHWIKQHKGLAVEIQDVPQFVSAYLRRYQSLLCIQDKDTHKPVHLTKGEICECCEISIRDDLRTQLHVDYMRKGLYHLFAADSTVLSVLFLLKKNSISYSSSQLLDILQRTLNIIYYQIPYITTDLTTILKSLTERHVLVFNEQTNALELSSEKDDDIQDYIHFCVSLNRDYLICASVFLYLLEGFRAHSDQIELELVFLQRLVCSKLAEYYQSGLIEYGISMSTQIIKNLVDFACENEILVKEKTSHGLVYKFDCHYQDAYYYHQYLGLAKILFPNIEQRGYKSRTMLCKQYQQQQTGQSKQLSRTPSIDSLILLRYYNESFDYGNYMITASIGPLYHKHDKVCRTSGVHKQIKA